MASIDPVVIDPDDVYVYIKLFAQYDTGRGNTSEIQSNIQKAIGDWAAQTKINNFNSTFRLGAFEKAVTLSDNSIADVSSQVSILKYIKYFNIQNIILITCNTPLYSQYISQ